MFKSYFRGAERDALKNYFRLPSSAQTAIRARGALDDLNLTAKPVAAYALRRLFGEYVGPQVRVRRSSDNVEADVFFDDKGVIELVQDNTESLVVDLETWLGGATAVVRTWYDQSTNNFPATLQTGTGAILERDVELEYKLRFATDGYQIQGPGTQTDITDFGGHDLEQAHTLIGTCTFPDDDSDTEVLIWLDGVTLFRNSNGDFAAGWAYESGLSTLSLPSSQKVSLMRSWKNQQSIKSEIYDPQSKGFIGSETIDHSSSLRQTDGFGSWIGRVDPERQTQHFFGDVYNLIVFSEFDVPSPEVYDALNH